MRIDPRVEHFLHEFWGMVGHLVNTLIFVISGVIIVTSIDVSCTLSTHPSDPNPFAYLTLCSHTPTAAGA